MGKIKKGAFWSDPAFKTLKSLWYDRLRAEGFKDCEVVKGPDSDYEDEDFHRWSSRFKADSEDYRDRFHDKQEYYRLAEHFLNLYRFKDPLDKAVWKAHSEGESAAEFGRRVGIAAESLRTRMKKLKVAFSEWRKQEAAKDVAVEGMKYDDE